LIARGKHICKQFKRHNNNAKKLFKARNRGPKIGRGSPLKPLI
jgi:hypothetical protein